MSSGSKPAIDDRLAVVGGDELERSRADHRRDVARADEPVEPQVGRLEQRSQRRHDRDVAADAGEVLDALAACALERQRGGRRGRLESDREEHDLAVRVLLGDPQRVQRRVDHAHVGARGLGVEQAPSEPGTRIMSPKQVKITPSWSRDRDPVVDAAHRDHAHGTARPVHELDVRRQQIVDAVLVDRVGVAAADLHHLVVAAGLDQRQDLAGERAAELGVAELVDELHAAASRREAMRSPCRRARAAARPTATGSTSAVSTVCRAPSASAHSASPAALVDPHDRHRHSRRRRR